MIAYGVSFLLSCNSPFFCIIYSMGLIRIFHLIWFLFVAVVGEKKVLIALVSQS